ncbi:MAG: 8-oxo-dGTP diphosphatase [Candidatus Erwinia impunctatus]|nr:8-oxo-dGTP diphosphatase [Culicoides impunctatus]
MRHLQVAVGIIRNAQKQIFLAQRSAESHMALMWEFPGGKIEADESAEAALKRELYEETGITVLKATAFGEETHTYADLSVTLHFFLVESWQDDPYGREGQPVRWVEQTQLDASQFPPANAPIVARLLKETD